MSSRRKCPGCCDCPEPIFEKQSRAKSLTKCGFDPNVFDPPYPYGPLHHIFKRHTYCEDDDGFTGQKTILTIDPLTCIVTVETTGCDEGCFAAAFADESGNLFKKKVTTTVQNFTISPSYGGGYARYTSIETRELVCTSLHYEGPAPRYYATTTTYSGHSEFSNDGVTYNSTQAADGSWSGDCASDPCSSRIGPFPGDSYTEDSGNGTTIDYSEPVTLFEEIYDQEYTTDELVTSLLATVAAEAYGAWATATVGDELTWLIISTDQLSGSAYQSKYRFRHKVSKVGRGCYLILWDQIYVPKCGVGIQSLEAYEPITGLNPGDTYPVTITGSATGGGGCTFTPATATATVDGSGVLIFSVGAHGTGYNTSATAVVTIDGIDIPVMVHLSGALQLSYQFDGTVPPGYDPAIPSTYPVTDEHEAAIPEGATADDVGAVYLMNIRSGCKGCT